MTQDVINAVKEAKEQSKPRNFTESVDIIINIRDLDVKKARFVGITGKDEDEIFENFIKAIADLKEKVGIKRTIKEYGIEEKDFMKTLDEMVENAFNDQCTSSNPRYPLMSEMKEMYLKAFHEG